MTTAIKLFVYLIAAAGCFRIHKEDAESDMETSSSKSKPATFAHSMLAPDNDGPPPLPSIPDDFDPILPSLPPLPDKEEEDDTVSQSDTVKDGDICCCVNDEKTQLRTQIVKGHLYHNSVTHLDGSKSMMGYKEVQFEVEGDGFNVTYPTGRYYWKDDVEKEQTTWAHISMKDIPKAECPHLGVVHLWFRGGEGGDGQIMATNCVIKHKKKCNNFFSMGGLIEQDMMMCVGTHTPSDSADGIVMNECRD